MAAILVFVKVSIPVRMCELLVVILDVNCKREFMAVELYDYVFDIIEVMSWSYTFINI